MLLTWLIPSALRFCLNPKRPRMQSSQQFIDQWQQLTRK